MAEEVKNDEQQAEKSIEKMTVAELREALKKEAPEFGASLHLRYIVYKLFDPVSPDMVVLLVVLVTVGELVVCIRACSSFSGLELPEPS